MESSFQIGSTSKGKRTLIYKQFEYWKHKENRNGTIRWRCREHQRKNCKPGITTRGDVIISNQDPSHTHFQDANSIKARSAVVAMKESMAAVGATPRAVIGTECQSLEDETLMRLPNRPSLQRTLQRAARQSSG